MTLVFAGVLATSAGQATALPAAKQTKIRTVRSRSWTLSRTSSAGNSGSFRMCAKQFLFANIQNSPAKEAALAAAKTACLAELNTLDGASSAFIDSVIAALHAGRRPDLHEAERPNGLRRSILDDLEWQTDINSVPELAGFLCANKTLFAVLIAAYEVRPGAQLFTTYVTNELARRA